MSDLHPNDKQAALQVAIEAIKAQKPGIVLADYHLHILEQMRADAIRETRP